MVCIKIYVRLQNPYLNLNLYPNLKKNLVDPNPTKIYSDQQQWRKVLKFTGIILIR
jgi:hypothetical protein